MTPTIFALIVFAAGLLTSGAQVVQASVVLCLFGAAAAIELPALGGAMILPAVMFLPFLIGHAIAQRGMADCLKPLVYPNAGFWLLVTAVLGVASAALLPRLFAGDVLIRTVDRTGLFGIDYKLMPLGPVSTNLTQSAYALGSVGVFAATNALLSSPGRLAKFKSAVLLLAVLDCIAATYNAAELYGGAPKLLTYLRGTGFVIFDGGDLGGLVRISGTFAEASAFSSFTLPLFAFCATLWLHGVDSKKTGAMALALLGFLLISTSGTAYVSLAAYLLTAGALAAGFLLFDRKIPRPGALLSIAGIVIVATCLVVLLRPGLIDRVVDFFDATVLSKSQSSSGVDRGSSNTQAWSNFVDTHGIGVGLGSARASSFVLVLLSNLGVVGTLCYLAFLRAVMFGRSDASTSSDGAVVLAARQAVLANLICASVSGTVFDLGVMFYAFAAAACAVSMRAATTTKFAHA
jgi:hypothetical protein